MDRISDLRLFVLLAETLSFTQTAAQLGVSRASVGRTIERLESQLETRLIHRTTRSVALTPDGATLLTRCTKLIADAEAIADMFSHSSDRPSGLLRVNVPSRMGRLLFMPRLPEFMARYPDIEISLAATDRPVDLVKEGFDCVVRVGEQQASGLVSRRIGLLQMVNCASPAYLHAHGTPKSLADLKNHLSVGYVSPRGKRDVGWESLDQGSPRIHRMEAALRVNSAELYIAAAVAGLGLIQVPAYDVKEMLASGELVEVLSEHPCAPMPVALVAPNRPSLVLTVKVFADWAADLVRNATAP